MKLPFTTENYNIDVCRKLKHNIIGISSGGYDFRNVLVGIPYVILKYYRVVGEQRELE